jgi:hypothetical protein
MKCKARESFGPQQYLSLDNGAILTRSPRCGLFSRAPSVWLIPKKLREANSTAGQYRAHLNFAAESFDVIA